MIDFLSSAKESVSFFTDTQSILAGAGGIALFSAAGVIPRLGLVRAFTFGWRSYFKTTYPLSVRKSEIQKLSSLISRMEKGSYFIVTGGKGHGKSCLIDTTLNRKFGVAKFSVRCRLYR